MGVLAFAVSGSRGLKGAVDEIRGPGQRQPYGLYDGNGSDNFSAWGGQLWLSVPWN